MMAMAQAAMAQARLARTPPMPGSFKGLPPKMGAPMADSHGGAGSPVPLPPGGPLPEMTDLKKGGWGKLPPKLAEDINKGLSQPIPDEYREAVETYYRVIAERSKKP